MIPRNIPDVFSFPDFSRSRKRRERFFPAASFDFRRLDYFERRELKYVGVGRLLEVGAYASFGWEALAPTDETERFSLRGSAREAREPIRVATRLTAIRNCGRVAPDNYLINLKGKEALAFTFCDLWQLSGSANRPCGSQPRRADDAEGNTTSWTYDSQGQVLTETNEKNAVRSYEYDDLGRLIESTDRNDRVIQYEYDYLGRQTAEKWLDENDAVIGSILYTYDGNNNPLTVTDTISDVSYEYRYDELNRRVYQYVNSAELDVPVEFTYVYNTTANTITETLTGRRRAAADSRSHALAKKRNCSRFAPGNYCYNGSFGWEALAPTDETEIFSLRGSANRQPRLAERTGATYKQNGDVVSESSWAYDAANRTTSIQHKKANDDIFAEYGLTWDAANRITEFETVDGAAEYTYDATGQLTGADYDYITDEIYSYDDNGNRVTANGDTYATGDNNETLADGTYRYSYDSEGNRTEKYLWTDTDEDGIIDESEKTLVQTYEWDYRNRLASVTNYDEQGLPAEVVEYIYDYLNQMIARSVTADNTTTSEAFIYSNGQIVLEYDTTSAVDAVTAVNLWGANVDELVAVERLAQSVNANNEILWSYSDHLHSIRDVAIYNPTTDTTTVINHLIYNAFGNLVSSTNPSNNSTTITPILVFRYTGKYFDDATQLQNNLNRWYDSPTGKWISVDPISFAGGDMNLYRYVGNNISTRLDYNGFKEKKFIKPIIVLWKGKPSFKLHNIALSFDYELYKAKKITITDIKNTRKAIAYAAEALKYTYEQFTNDPKLVKCCIQNIYKSSDSDIEIKLSKVKEILETMVTEIQDEKLTFVLRPDLPGIATTPLNMHRENNRENRAQYINLNRLFFMGESIFFKQIKVKAGTMELPPNYLTIIHELHHHFYNSYYSDLDLSQDMGDYYTERYTKIEVLQPRSDNMVTYSKDKLSELPFNEFIKHTDSFAAFIYCVFSKRK